DGRYRHLELQRRGLQQGQRGYAVPHPDLPGRRLLRRLAADRDAAGALTQDVHRFLEVILPERRGHVGDHDRAARRGRVHRMAVADVDGDVIDAEPAVDLVEEQVTRLRVVEVDVVADVALLAGRARQLDACLRE